MTNYVRHGLKRGKAKTREASGYSSTTLGGGDACDVEETRAARLDGWISWEAEERVAQ